MCPHKLNKKTLPGFVEKNVNIVIDVNKCSHFFVLGVDVIGDIGYVFATWQAHNIDHGNKTRDIMTEGPVLRVNINTGLMVWKKYFWMFLH